MADGVDMSPDEIFMVVDRKTGAFYFTFTGVVRGSEDRAHIRIGLNRQDAKELADNIYNGLKVVNVDGQL